MIWRLTENLKSNRVILRIKGLVGVLAPEINQPLRFQGQYADRESGLYYNLNRYYDPGVGLYLTEDPVKLDGGLNSYQYADGNSVLNIDPLGLKGMPGSATHSIGERAPEPIPKVDTAEPSIIEVNPKILVPTQGKDEMTGSVIKKVKKSIKNDGIDHGRPIYVWRNPLTNRLEIQDGHHRTAAALELKLDKVPIRVWGED